MKKLLVLLSILFFTSNAWSSTVTLLPNGDGTNIQWTPTPTGTHWTCVDDNADTADYVNSATTNLKDEYAMENAPALLATATAIDAYDYGYKITAEAGQVYVAYSTDNGSNWSADQSLGLTLAGGTAWWNYKWTGLSLTKTQIDNLQLRYTYTKPSIGQARIYSAKAIITYTALIVDVIQVTGGDE